MPDERWTNQQPFESQKTRVGNHREQKVQISMDLFRDKGCP